VSRGRPPPCRFFDDVQAGASERPVDRGIQYSLRFGCGQERVKCAPFWVLTGGEYGEQVYQQFVSVCIAICHRDPGFKIQVQHGVDPVVPGRLRLVYGIRDIFLAGC
jgi:hypothetical protein